jgi:hypothetical protein
MKRSEIERFEGVRIRYCALIDLSDDRIGDFIDLRRLSFISQLLLDGNRISSSEGCVRLRRLTFLSLGDTPILRNSCLTLISLVTFGPQLTRFNDEYFPPRIRDAAQKLERSLLPLLTEGNVIPNLTPLKMVDTGGRRHSRRDLDLLTASLTDGHTTPPIEKNGQAGPDALGRAEAASIARPCDRAGDDTLRERFLQRVAVAASQRMRELRAEFAAPECALQADGEERAVRR